MKERKTCPLRDAVLCIEHRCMWYSEESEDVGNCVMYYLPYLYNIAIELSNIMHKLQAR